jgi:transketolase
VTAEEHQQAGGLGESVSGVLARHVPVPMEMVAVQDSFGESGVPDQLLEKYGLGPTHVADAVRKVLRRKNG